jgi:phage baseplate assembly protein W
LKKSYYKIPLDFENIFPKHTEENVRPFTPSIEIKKTHTLKKSVDEHIELIITTRLGEYKYNREFGFEIWDLEFENLQIEKFNTHNYPRQDLEKYLQSTIEKFEPRIKNVKVEILFVYKKIFKGKKIKFFVDITVKGILVNHTEESYARSFQFAMGPFFK